MLNVYPCGYSIHSAKIATLMAEDPSLLLIDIRKTPDSQMAAWKRGHLIEAYEYRYGWFGETLGNLNYKNGGPITLANPVRGIASLVDLLQQGHNLLLLCGCAHYQTCHRRVVAELLQQALPELTLIHPDQLAAPGILKCLSIRQPWAWLITHPEALRAAQVPIKDLENRDWTSSYRGTLYIHASNTLDTALFERRTGQLDRWHWQRKLGSAGATLYQAMPKHRDDYPRKAIVGLADFTGILTSSENPWFNGPYALQLAGARSLTPISYPGSLKIFEVPAQTLH
jgi:rhodanese-related sulfurtransferase